MKVGCIKTENLLWTYKSAMKTLEKNSSEYTRIDYHLLFYI